MQSEVATHGPGEEPAIGQEVAPPSSAAQVVAPPLSAAQPATSQPIHAFTQPISSMLQSFVFEDTRSGYYDDYEVDYPQI